MKKRDEAKVLEITQAYWSAIRHGKKVPSLKLAEKIEKTLPQYKVIDLIPAIKKIIKRTMKD